MAIRHILTCSDLAPRKPFFYFSFAPRGGASIDRNIRETGTGKMNDGYVYEQFGMWWVFLDANRRPPIQLSGPYRTRELAEAALVSLRAAVTMPSAP